MSTRYQAAVEEGEVLLLEDEWAKGEWWGDGALTQQTPVPLTAEFGKQPAEDVEKRKVDISITGG